MYFWLKMTQKLVLITLRHENTSTQFSILPSLKPLGEFSLGPPQNETKTNDFYSDNGKLKVQEVKSKSL